MLQDHNCNYDDTTPDWSVKVNNDRRNPEKLTKDYIPSNENAYIVVQISDTHFDPKYLMGANAVCNTPVCCRVDSVKKLN